MSAVTVTAQGKLGTLLAPASIAIVGASANPDGIGSRVLSNLRRHGYPGRVFVINSRHQEVSGLRSYPSLTALDQVPDLALLAIDADSSLTVLAEYAELGGRNAQGVWSTGHKMELESGIVVINRPAPSGVEFPQGGVSRAASGWRAVPRA